MFHAPHGRHASGPQPLPRRVVGPRRLGLAREPHRRQGGLTPRERDGDRPRSSARSVGLSAELVQCRCRCEPRRPLCGLRPSAAPWPLRRRVRRRIALPADVAPHEASTTCAPREGHGLPLLFLGPRARWPGGQALRAAGAVPACSCVVLVLRTLGTGSPWAASRASLQGFGSRRAPCRGGMFLTGRRIQLHACAWCDD